jgi:hypothetical protein
MIETVVVFYYHYLFMKQMVRHSLDLKAGFRYLKLSIHCLV